jgi:anaerobic magnesium-protoporphyrin IX monomethyl ester cyclase
MADVLLTHGYFIQEDEKERHINKPYPTLGLLYLSAYLKRAGFGVEVFDATFAERSELDARLAAEPGGVLGIYTNLITRVSVLDVVRRAKGYGWTVILGGPESANYPDEYLAHGADVVVVGEGEETMAELIPALAAWGPHRLHAIAGAVFRDEDGKVVHNAGRAQIADINSLPWPDRDAIDLQRYVETWRTHHGRGSVNLITARGCPYKCTWCSHAVFGYSHRRRDLVNCADELQYIVETYKPDMVWYADDVFTIHHRWLAGYADEIARRGINIPFETISRADRMMKEEVVKTLADMGCWRIWIGSESGSQRILDSMERRVAVEQVQQATKLAQKHGIEVGMFLMWGYDGETMEDIEATIDHVKKAAPDVFLTTVAYPIKNTPYYNAVKDRVVMDQPWDQGTDRDFRIRGRHSRTYYDHANNLLKHEVEAHRMAGSDQAVAAQARELALASRAGLLATAGEVEA